MRAVRVVGGGPAGVMAALAAMREGAPSTGRRGGRVRSAGTTLPRLCGGNKCATLGLAPGRLIDCGLLTLAFLRNRSDDLTCRDTDPAERRCKK